MFCCYPISLQEHRPVTNIGALHEIRNLYEGADNIFCSTSQHAEPRKIVLQVLSSYAVEALHKLLHSGMRGVDMIDMVNTSLVLATFNLAQLIAVILGKLKRTAHA